MYNFLVLGLIPGTNIQIGFYAWIALVISLMVATYFANKKILQIINAPDFEFEIRKPLHANQLHSRGL